MLPPSAKPYLVRAIYEWCLDQNLSPHIVVSVDYPGVVIPQGYAKDGKITLNISPRAVHSLTVDNEWLSFLARFGGKAMKIELPVEAIMAVFAMETQEGLGFGEPTMPSAPEAPSTPVSPPEPTPNTGKRPSLRVVK